MNASISECDAFRKRRISDSFGTLEDVRHKLYVCTEIDQRLKRIYFLDVGTFLEMWSALRSVGTFDGVKLYKVAFQLEISDSFPVTQPASEDFFRPLQQVYRQFLCEALKLAREELISQKNTLASLSVKA
ncbi:hypothetical protein KC865_03020 [Candidatus Kaiserbacteria bacterium]|nr:hypothetical protein [Candidatus Kaiserbacteria bacterium]USN91917.1 MAG: hypothetical protein H6782_03515 [Candidatus Nomurabacteria bacterium]